jgi:hypothetical protein
MVLLAGRVTHVLSPDVAEEGKEEALAALTEKDPAGEKFKEVSADAPVSGLSDNPEAPGFAWISKVVGDTQSYN